MFTFGINNRRIEVCEKSDIMNTFKSINFDLCLGANQHIFEYKQLTGP